MKSKILCKQLILIYKININIIKFNKWDFLLGFPVGFCNENVAN